MRKASHPMLATAQAVRGSEAGAHIFGTKAGVVGVHAVLRSTVVGGYAVVPVTEWHS